MSQLFRCRYDEVGELLERTIEVTKERLSSDCQDTLMPMGDRSVCSLQGWYDDAEALHKRALEGVQSLVHALVNE
jgi:hypothetical protein